MLRCRCWACELSLDVQSRVGPLIRPVARKEQNNAGFRVLGFRVYGLGFDQSFLATAASTPSARRP